MAMETMHFFIVQKDKNSVYFGGPNERYLSLRTKILFIFGVPMNDLAPMKNCPGGGGGQGRSN